MVPILVLYTTRGRAGSPRLGGLLQRSAVYWEIARGNRAGDQFRRPVAFDENHTITSFSVIYDIFCWGRHNVNVRARNLYRKPGAHRSGSHFLLWLIFLCAFALSI